MEVSNAHLHQVAMGSLPLEEALIGCPKLQQRGVEEEKKKMTTKPEPEQSLKCPRCDSTNTKFCYYNNYSLSQPRYFCKGCRRYWTKGGSLRNVPVGGGCRKSKKSSSSSSSFSSSAASSSKRPQDHLHHPHHLPFINPINCTPLLPPLLAYDPNDLSLALASLQQQQQLLLSGNNNEEGSFLLENPNHGVYLDMLRTGGLYCGHGDEEVAAVSSLPFGGGATTTTATTVTASASEGGDRELGAGADCRNILGWDAGREHDNCNYWNDGGFLCSKLQSLTSSSSLNYSDN